jgi:solute:Na+ symporter, SSS family
VIAGLSFFAFTAGVAVIAWWFSRRDRMNTAEAYFLAGRSLTAWVIAGSLMLTNLSTEHLIGLNGDAFNHTIAVMAWETTAALAMVLAALYFVPKYLRVGLATIPDFLAMRFDVRTRLVATLLFLFSYSIAILPVVLLFGATGLESLFDVSTVFGISGFQAKWLMVFGIGLLGSLYAIAGGLKAVAISDTINGIGFLAAGLLIPVLALSMVGDGDVLAGLSTVYAEEHPKFDITGNEPGSFLPFGVLFTGMIVNQVFFWCTNQSIIQRALGAKNLKEAQKGVLIAAVFKLIAPLAIVLPGVIAFHLFKDTLGPGDYLKAYPTLVKTVLPAPLAGFFAAVMVGAVLSTFNSVLNSAATLFNQGVFKPLFRPEASDRSQVKAGRWCSAALAVAAVIIAPTIDTSGSLYIYLQQINATFFGPMLAVILAGLLTKRATADAALTGLIAGPMIFYLINFVFTDEVQRFAARVFGGDSSVHFLHLLAIVFLLTSAIIAMVSKVRPSAYRSWHIEAAPVDLTPWRYARPFAAAIVIATLATYALLSQ